LIQKTIWWIEYAGIDGIRVDTQPYSFPEFTSQWSERVFFEYPDFMLVGEAWLQKESFTSWFQKDSELNRIADSGIPVVTDFPLYYALNDAFKEPDGWTTGLARIYYVLAQDFMYAHPMNKLIFCDNHDLNRYYSSVGENLSHFLMGMTFLFTTRGIPMLYYGSEILMTGFEHHGHGEIRKDFPGGWPGDPIDLFDITALNSEQQKAFNYLSALLAWRKSSRAAAYGDLTHFIPEDGVYVYFRKTAGESFMVIMNKNKTTMQIGTGRFVECLAGYSRGRDVINGNILNDLSMVEMYPESALVIELMK